MKIGIPLNDDDREPWLERLRTLIHEETERGNLPVVACSALKKKYRDHLRRGNEGLHFVFLRGSFDLIFARMQTRQGHYMPPPLLQSQFDALEAPDPEEAIPVGIDQRVPDIIDEIVEQLHI